MDTLKEAEAAYAHAKEQVKKWSSVKPQTMSSREHVAVWAEEMQKHSWCLPGRADEEVKS